MTAALIKNSFFDPSALRIIDSTPVKVTFLRAAPENGRHILGFYTLDSGRFRDIRLLFPNVHNESLIPNVSSVFLGNRLNGKTPVFFMVEDGYALNADSAWFQDAASGKNGFWTFLQPPAEKDLFPALERGVLVWKNDQGRPLETAEEARQGTPHPVLIWQSNDGRVFPLQGVMFHSFGYGLYPKLNPDRGKHAVLILEEENASVILNFTGSGGEEPETSADISLRLQIGERNFAALTRNRVGCFIPLGLARETVVTEMTLSLPPESGNTLYLESYEDQTTLPLARQTFLISNEGARLTVSAEAPAPVYEALCGQVKIRTNAPEPAECPVEIILQTSRGEIRRRGSVAVLSENMLSGTIFSSLPRFPAADSDRPLRPHIFFAETADKNADPLPSFLTQPAEERHPAKSTAAILTKPMPNGRTVLITGGAKRIGRATALHLARRGWNILIHANTSLAEAGRLVEEIQQSSGVKAAYIRADLADAAETAGLIPEAEKTYGTIEALINNAAVFEQDELISATPETWEKNMAVNLRAPFLLTQAFARQIPKGKEGSVVNILDQRVLNPTPYFMSYTLSKSALAALTRTAALALAPAVRVNAVAPGDVLPAAGQTKSDFERRCASTPLGRGASPDEIADAVVFLTETPSVTGQILALDGGQHLNWAPEGKR